MFEQKSVAVVIILSLVTCGIYTLYWVYVTSRDLNEFLQVSDMNPAIEMLLCLTGIYFLYWLYKYGQRAADATQRVGLPRKDDGILLLILAVVGLSIVSMGILQSTINSVVAAKASY